jgi:branched-chain amino acid transport system ATP-binding protein
MTEPIIQVRGLSKNFGGLAAVDDVSLDVKVGELHAVIGPNGAGKTTLINMLSGDLSANAGSILFGGIEVVHLTPERRSRLRMGRSYQKINIFSAFSALENCRLAAQSREPRPLNWLRSALSYDGVLYNARQALSAVGLANRAATIAAALSHGEQRQLEIAMSLATDPQLLLLDEPLAGMGTEESLNMIELIGELARSHAILLVEHDMDAVFRLARVLTVMVNGKILASGTPEAIRANREVQSAYLGSTEGLV